MHLYVFYILSNYWNFHRLHIDLILRCWKIQASSFSISRPQTGLCNPNECLQALTRKNYLPLKAIFCDSKHPPCE